MNINDFEKDIKLLKEKSPESYNDVARICIPFFMFYQKIFNSVNVLLKEKYDLTRSEIDVLGSLYYSGGEEFTLSPTDLCGRLLFSSGGMTKVFKRLEKKSYIVRVENKDDKRSKLVQLHKDQKGLVPIVLKDVFATEEKCLEKLTREDRKVFEKLLLKALGANV